MSSWDDRMQAALDRHQAAQAEFASAIASKDELLDKAKVLATGAVSALEVLLTGAAASAGVPIPPGLIHSASQQLLSKAITEMSSHQSDEAKK